MRNFVASVVCCCACLCAAPAYAFPDEAHTGLFVRLNAGLAYMNTSEAIGTAITTTTGIAGMGEFGVGWAVIPNLIVHLDVASAGVIGPKVSIKGGDATAIGSGSPADTVANFGVGVTYYMMPYNFWVGGAVGGSAAWLDYGGGRLVSDIGWGFVANFGKEFWVSQNWGLGFAGELLFSAVPNDVSNVTYNLNTLAFGILVCASYN